MDFRCGNVSLSVPYFSCLNSGICQVDDLLGEHCVCSDGWVHDTIGWGHFLNCALPSSFLPTFFITYTALFSIGFLLAFYQLRTTTAKGKILLVGRGCVAWSLSSYTNVVFVFAQGGYYEGAIITFAIYS